MRATCLAGEAIDMMNADFEHKSVWTGDQKAVTKVRCIQKTDYDNPRKDYSEPVDAHVTAIDVLNKRAYGRKHVLYFVQVSVSQCLGLIPKEAKVAMVAFLDDPDDCSVVVTPEASGYEF